MQEIKETLAVAAFKAAEATAATVAAARMGNTHLKVDKPATVEVAIQRKLEAIKAEVTRLQRELWVERSIALYNEWAKEMNLKRKSNFYKKDLPWFKKVSSRWEVLEWTNNEVHQETFDTLCGESKEAFENMILNTIFANTKEGDSRSYIMKETRKAVSQAQRLWACYMKSGSNECTAIYAAALKDLRSQGYDAYCITLSSKIRKFYVGADALAHDIPVKHDKNAPTISCRIGKKMRRF